MDSCEDNFATPARASHHKNAARRAACDRCRAQKLRCEIAASNESHVFGKCARCQNADVRCHFSPQGQHGRPPRGTRSISTPRTGVDNLYSSMTKGRSNPRSKQRPGLCSFGLDKDVASPSYESPIATISTALKASNNDINMEGEFTFPEFPTFWEPSINSMPTDEHNLFVSSNGGLHTSCDHDSNTPFNGVPAPEHKRIESAADEFAGGLHSEQPGTKQVDEAQEPSLPYTDDFDNFGLPPATPEGVLSGSGRHHDITGTFETRLRNQKQQLAELSIQLDRQTTSYGRHVAPKYHMIRDAYPEDLAGAVLDSSFAFLDLLITLQNPNFQCEHSTVQLPTSQGQTAINDNIRLSTCPGCHRLPSPSTSNTSNNSTEDLASSNTSSLPILAPGNNRAKTQVVDIATSLQLLACYMHIIHLHSLFYTATRTYMTRHSSNTCASTDASATAPRPLFPTLQVHGVALTRPSILKFQFQFLLKISLDTLGKIEAALGLPQGCGVRQSGTASKAETRDNYGVLEASVSSQLVAVVMCEEGAVGCERVREIRETVEVLRDEFRGEIDF